MIYKTNRAEIQSYLEDTSNLAGSADILYIPENIDDLKKALADCLMSKRVVTFSAGRTGTTGGCVPQNGAVISFERFNAINMIDESAGVLKVSAGVTLSVIESFSARYGFCLRAVPTESLACIGGAVSTAASGMRGFRYGSIRSYVLGMDVMLYDGTILNLKRGSIFADGYKFCFESNGKKFEFDMPDYNMPDCKSQAGYYTKADMDIIDLFIGSEGTLGIILSVTLQLQKKPWSVFDGLAFFVSEHDAFNFVSSVRTARLREGFNPTSLEFLDKNSLDFVKEDFSFIPSDCMCAVYFEQESDRKEERDASLDVWMRILERNNAILDTVIIAETEAERAKLFDFRHKIPQNINEFLRKYSQVKLSADLAVPHDKFLKLYEFYKINAEQSGIRYVNFGHIGEAHLHFNFLPCTDEESFSAKKYMKEFAAKAISLGGSISAEHGVGKLKREYLAMMYGKETINKMRQVKKVFDPYGMFNKGNIF
ncbi:MAG: FAD-binding oxidoreductase [Candidatus Omnitrophica bacterium]|nr:FAD-binding oxidoreductase [Candidatus Omnitrophota bacterium]MDD5080770.1 FAD-binding oxidoreductase [Candidatus Omnitrophota bacterium]MDD5440902.1 FAD-binding oxidoreductase [Candidatus Omnitrophota bacterium]